MNTLVLEHEPVACNVTASDQELIVELVDGRVLKVPLSWYPRLLHGTPAQRQNVQLFGDGYAMEWPDLDEHIGVDGLLAGRRSAESAASLDQWLALRSEKQSIT